MERADEQFVADAQANRAGSHGCTIALIQGLDDGHRIGIERDDLEWNAARAALDAQACGKCLWREVPREGRDEYATIGGPTRVVRHVDRRTAELAAGGDLDLAHAVLGGRVHVDEAAVARGDDPVRHRTIGSADLSKARVSLGPGKRVARNMAGYVLLQIDGWLERNHLRRVEVPVRNRRDAVQ